MFARDLYGILNARCLSFSPVQKSIIFFFCQSDDLSIFRQRSYEFYADEKDKVMRRRQSMPERLRKLSETILPPFSRKFLTNFPSVPFWKKRKKPKQTFLQQLR